MVNAWVSRLLQLRLLPIHIELKEATRVYINDNSTPIAKGQPAWLHETFIRIKRHLLKRSDASPAYTTYCYS